jgi:hypothetical protein
MTPYLSRESFREKRRAVLIDRVSTNRIIEVLRTVWLDVELEWGFRILNL